MSQLVKISVAITLGLIICACRRSSDFHIYPASIDCEELSCVVSFDVENLKEYELSLVYEATLNQNYVRDPSKSGIFDVGSGRGEVSLRPKERKTVLQSIAVSEAPNGSKVIIVRAND